MKIDYSKSTDFDKSVKTNRKDKAEAVVNKLINIETYNLLNEAKIYNISVDLIDIREVNEFEEISLATLKESIQKTGLQHNIVVKVNNDRYTVISGNRRLSAIKELHQEYPNDSQYLTIPCKVCQIVGEGTPNNNYVQITSEQEENIYKDTNFENRQLGIDTAIKHIDYLIDKIENSKEYYQLALNNSNNNSKYNKVVFDKYNVIADILTKNLGFSGWSRSSVYRILKIREKDKKQLEMIANGEKSIRTVYDELYPKTKKTKKKVRYTNFKNIYKQLKKINDKFEDEQVIYTGKIDSKYVKEIIAVCNNIIEKTSKEKEIE